MITPLIQLAIVALIIWICVRAIWRATMIPPDLLRGERCGTCSYRLGGIRGRCPECGANLHDAGIKTPLTLVHERTGTAGALIAWSVLVFAFLGLAGVGIDWYRGPVANMAHTRVRTRLDLAPYDRERQTPETGSEDYWLTMKADVATGRDGAVESGSVVVTVSTSTAKRTAGIDAASLTYTVDGESRAGSFDRHAAARLFESAGLDPNRESTAAEARSIAAMVKAARSDPLDHFSGSGPGNLVRIRVNSNLAMIPRPTDWIRVASISLGVLVWIAGVVLIIRRRRSILSTVKTQYGKTASVSPD